MNESFNNFFDNFDEVVKIETPIDVPIFIYTEDDLKNAQDLGYSRGFSRGLEEGYVQGELKALTERQLQAQAAFVKIYQDLENLFQIEKAYHEKLHQQVILLSKEIIKKLFPFTFNKYGCEELFKAMNSIFDTLIDEKPIIVYLHPSLINDIKDRFLEIKNKFHDRVTFLENNNINLWECHIEWKGGGARWSQEELLNETGILLEKYLNLKSEDE